jgi:hypothetical protein
MASLKKEKRERRRNMQDEQENWMKEADATIDRVLADNEGNVAAVYTLWLTCTRFLAEAGSTEAELNRDVTRHVRDQQMLRQLRAV